MAQNLSNPAISNAYTAFARAVEVASRLLSWADAVRKCEVDANRYLQGAKAISRDLAKTGVVAPSQNSIKSFARAVAEITDIDEVPNLLKLALAIPLPVPLTMVPQATDWMPRAAAKTKPTIVVAFTAFRMNGTILSDAHTVDSDTIYDLGVDVSVSKWPEQATELVVEPASVEDRDTYDFPTFKFDRPTQDPPYTFSGLGRMRLRYPTSFFARPLEFVYLARFLPPAADLEVVTEGQRRLHFRSYDPERDPQSGYVQVERRLIEIRDQARGVPGTADRELHDFLTLMAALGGIAGEALQDNIFRGDYSEPTFQTQLRGLLRARPRIGSQLDEHPRAGGGITDLSFHGIRLELKVAGTGYSARNSLLQYLPQTSQYVIGSDRKFGVLCLLDYSRKNQSPGSVSDDIALEVLPPPSGSGLPICVGTVIIRGNLAQPSSL